MDSQEHTSDNIRIPKKDMICTNLPYLTSRPWARFQVQLCASSPIMVGKSFISTPVSRDITSGYVNFSCLRLSIGGDQIRLLLWHENNALRSGHGVELVVP